MKSSPHNVGDDFCLSKGIKMFSVISKPQETSLVRLYRVEFAKDYKIAIDNRLDINDMTIRSILGYKEEPKRKKIFGIF
jgi:hypothetical protein